MDELRREFGLTSVFISHNFALIERIAEERAGRSFFDTPRTFEDDPR